MENINVGDIVEIRISEKIILPDGEEIQSDADIFDYERKYSISYDLNDKPFCFFDITVEKGCISFVEDIVDLINEDLKETIPKINEYEIIEIKDRMTDYQKAKVKIISLNEE